MHGPEQTNCACETGPPPSCRSADYANALYSILDSLGYPLIVVDSAGNIIAHNRCACEQLAMDDATATFEGWFSRLNATDAAESVSPGPLLAALSGKPIDGARSTLRMETRNRSLSR